MIIARFESHEQGLIGLGSKKRVTVLLRCPHFNSAYLLRVSFSSGIAVFEMNKKNEINKMIFQLDLVRIKVHASASPNYFAWNLRLKAIEYTS